MKHEHRKNKSVTGFKKVNGKLIFFAHVEVERVEVKVNTMTEVKEEKVKENKEGCGCW